MKHLFFAFLLIISTLFVSTVFAMEAKSQSKKATPAMLEVPAQSAAQPPACDDTADKEDSRHSIHREGWEFRAVVGLDFQVANTKISQQTTYSDADGEYYTGGAAGFLARRYFTPKFAISTGGEFVSRRLIQDYSWIFWSGDETAYDVLSFEVPIYFELVLGSGKHVLYAGPRLATPVYQHCSSSDSNSSSVYPCVKDAGASLFIPLQIGYNLRLGHVFGFNFFMERTVTPVIDKEGIEAQQFRTGTLATFYF